VLNCRSIAVAVSLSLTASAHAQTPPAGAEVVELAPPSPRPQAPPGTALGLDTPEQRGWSGALGAREDFRLRTSSDAADGSAGEHDQDLIFGLDGALRSPAGSVSAVLDASVWLDLAGTQPNPTSLTSLRDGRRNPWVQLFDAYGQYESEGAMRLLRVGHQVAEHGVPVPFDGAYAVVRAGSPRLDLYVLGGRAAYFYAVDANLFDDWLGSAGLVARPLDDLKLELDYRLETQVLSLDGGPRTRHSDSIYGGSATYRLSDTSRVKLTARAVDTKLSTAALAVSLVSAPGDLGLDLRAAVQPTELDTFTESSNPYFLTLGPSLAHWRGRADAWKSLSFEPVRLEAHVGYEARQQLEGDARPFNPNTARVYALASIDRLSVLPGVVLTVTADRIATKATLQGQGEWAVGGSVGWAGERLRAEVGTAFYAYRYDYYRTLEQLSDVRTYYADLRGRLFDWLAVRARYTLEVFDRRLQTVSVGVSESF